MSDIPKAMELINSVMFHLGAATTLLRFALAELPREKPVRKAAVKSTRMTKKMKQRIAAYAAANPDAALHHIAAAFNVNPGRVSEVLNKK